MAWNAAADSQTPAAGLTYNLRVGVTRGGTQIVAPMAITSTGYRKVPALGNANLGLTATLNITTPGTYYWSVQAIDTAWAGSPFAAEGSFSNTNVLMAVIDGPLSGVGETVYTFTATINPPTTTLPITYTWQAGGQSPVTHPAISRLTDAVTFTWPWGASGSKAITVTAANAGGLVTGTSAINLNTLPLFSEVSTTLTDAASGSVAWGDYDNDGRLDVLLTGRTISSTQIAKVYHNNGNGTFTDIGAGLTGVEFSSVAWGDYDNDGRLDILLTGYTGSTRIATVYHNNGNDTFTDIGAGLTGVSDGSVAWGDYDNDGRVDILSTGATGSTYTATVYHNNGNGTFTDIGAGLTGVDQSSVAWGDYDNDGRLDILLTGYTGSTRIATVYHNNGNGTFTDIGAGLTGGDSSAAWGDYDNDGRLDILLALAEPMSSVMVYHNNGNGTFTDIGEWLMGPGPEGGSVAWGDYDNDGWLDILSANSGIVVYHNNGNGTFTNTDAGLEGGSSSAAWGDYDNDGRLDILSTGYGATKVYHNNTQFRNSIPAAPTGLRATVAGTTTVNFAWDAASDGQTPAAGLTYNLRVGTTRRGTQIAAPMASTSTGYRQVPALGNANLGLTATLNITTSGTYYWSVQAIDTAWAGSPFAAEGSFGAIVPPTGVIISGLTSGAINTAYTFAATVSPVTATLPITYVWQASGQSPITHWAINGLTDTVTFTWLSGVSGTQAITVTAANVAGIITDTAAINISPLFSEISTTLAGVDGGSVAWGDYDNDGRLDILLTGYTISSTCIARVYHNNGNRTFTDIGAGLPGVIAGSVAWGDYDNDGWLDILLTGSTQSVAIAKVYHNNGNGTFTDIGAGLTGVDSGSVAWSDYDNDGRLDILLTGGTFTGTYVAKVYHNNGNGTFTDIGAGLTGVSDSSVAWGDYDNDGRLDILLTGSTSVTSTIAIATVYHNNGNGTFTAIGAGLTGVYWGSVAWGDYDNDGRLDILLTGYGSTPIAKVYHNNGNGTFTDIGAEMPGVYASSVAWGDYDNDGRLDILLTGNTAGGSDIAKVYHNNGNGTFTDSGAGLTGVAVSSVAWGDYDNDGRLDILLTGYTGSGDIAKIYHNNTPPTNSVPAAPTGLRAAVAGATVNLAWDAAADSQTPAAGLTYNLRVGTTPGGEQIAAPMATTSTGYRKVPALGNVQHGLTVTLVLTPGTYYWSAQAIDTAWAGSPFAAEGSFGAIVPLTGVVISGPTTGTVNTAYTFTTTVSPPTATLPITYVWQATGQTPITHTGSLIYSDTANFTWSVGGAKTITVTASNADGMVTATAQITLTTPPSSPHLYLAPADTTQPVAQIFTVEIKADTGSNTADTLDAYLDFDPAVLQVVDASGVPVSAIEPNTTALPNVTYNAVNNTTGQIDFSASNYTTPLNGTFTAATIRFKAMAVVASTGITLVRSGSRWSDLLYQGESLTSDLSGTVAHITFMALPGRVTLEKRGVAGDAKWVTPLYRVSGTGVVTGGVRLYQPGTSNLSGVYSATTDATGRFTVTLEGAPAGVYDAQVKGANTLSNKRLNVSLPAAGEIDFGTLLVGDNNGDDKINGGDVSYMIPSFTKCMGDPAFRPYADTNNNGCINGADVSALIPNFLKTGPIIVTPTLMSLSAAQSGARASQADASLILSPTNPAVQAGDVFTLNIVFDTGTSQADTVDAYIDFDSAILEVVDAAGAPASTIQANTSVLPNVLYNTVDNTLGQIGFSAYKLTPLSGSFTAATLRFRAKAAASASSVNLVRSEGRVSDLYYGESIEPTLGNASVIVGAPTAVTLQDLSASARGNSNGLMSFAALFALLGLGAFPFTRRVKGKAQP